MGTTCKPMAVSFQCMTKPTTKKKKITSSLPPTASLAIPQAGHEGEITSEETASLHSMENDTEPNILRSMIH